MVEGRKWTDRKSGRIQDSGKNHKRTCLNPVLPAGIREEPRHSNVLLKEAILASARALSPCFLARGPPFQAAGKTGFRIQDSVLRYRWLIAFVTKPTYWPSINRITLINDWLGARPRLRGRKDFGTTLSSSLQAQIAERFTEGAGAYPNSEGVSRKRSSDYPDDHCWPSGLAEIIPPISTDMAAFILRRFDY